MTCKKVLVSKVLVSKVPVLRDRDVRAVPRPRGCWVAMNVKPFTRARQR
jgi:hypothetical protein